MQAGKDSVQDEQDLALAEIEHRMQNAFQIIDSLIHMQIRSAQGEEARTRLRRLAKMVRVVATIQTRLAGNSDDGLAGHLEALAVLWRDIGRQKGLDVVLKVEDCFDLPDPMVGSTALIVQELITNAFEHAFPNGRAGSVVIEAVADGTDGRIVIADDGIGFDGGYADGDAARRGGFRLVRSLARSLGGRLEIRSAPASGTVATLDLPLATGGEA